jgi:hypothetical protein
MESAFTAIATILTHWSFSVNPVVSVVTGTAKPVAHENRADIRPEP